MMIKTILEKEMFEGGPFNMVWEDLLDTLRVDPVSPVEDPDAVEYPDRVEITVEKVRVL